MANKNRLQAPDIDWRELESKLLESPQKYAFSDMYRYLSYICISREAVPSQSIRIYPSLSLARKRTEVVNLKANRQVDGDEKALIFLYELEVSFMGLYGASSPLPAFYTDDLIESQKDGNFDARLFLDIFHQRSYHLYAESLIKYNPLLASSHAKDGDFDNVVWSLLGFKEFLSNKTSLDPKNLLNYFLIYSKSYRSASGLEAVLSDFVGSKVVIHQLVPSASNIPKKFRFCLGLSGNQLGDDVFLGDSMLDYTKKIIVEIADLTFNKFDHLVNSIESWKRLISLISYYVNDNLECELVMKVNQSKYGSLKLMDDFDNTGPSLGLNTWIFDTPRADVPPVMLTADICVNHRL